MSSVRSHRLYVALLALCCCTPACGIASAQVSAPTGQGPELKQALDFLVKNSAPSVTCHADGETFRSNQEVSYEMRGEHDALLTLTYGSGTDAAHTETVLVSDLANARFGSTSSLQCDSKFAVTATTRDQLKRVRIERRNSQSWSVSEMEFDAETPDLSRRMAAALKRALELAKPEQSAF